MSERKRGLGRGLSALMADIPDAGPDGVPARPDRVVAIERIVPNPDQPRRRFDEDALEELAASIRSKGVIQPLIVRAKGEGYEIVAGERRWRAAQRAQVHELPVVVREFDDTEVLEVAIIENVQRADLNPLEEAAGYRALMDRFGHTQEQLAEAMGKSRSHLANLLRLLNLPGPVQHMVRDGQLSMGHARVLAGNENATILAHDAATKGWSVRQLEAKAKAAGGGGTAKRGGQGITKRKDADVIALEEELSGALGMKVEVETGKDDNGRVVIHYDGMGALDDLVAHLGVFSLGE
ncbi:ParB family chromosome partitioning protein [Hasllibacter halocynthiae]|uniref:ParB family chromosome partitioning protein n=1 Tax=Hasllibacter halocynthiae TaxID=595589 RepID=A0A2T0X2E0_9RHOB|nr:ParB family chromosome partitioning protein [Hasllibacter halocynthiae]